MENAERLKRLNMLKCMLLNHDTLFPETGFNLSAWQIKYPENIKYSNQATAGHRECGTAACALGSAALFEPFQKMGLRITKNGYNAGGFGIKYEDKSDFRAGAEFFGIGIHESYCLFDPSNYRTREGIYDSHLDTSHAISTNRVASRVQELIEKYSQ